MSKIEWTGETWNPIAGCSIVSPGCTNCYAMRTAARLEAMDFAQRAKPLPGSGGKKLPDPDTLPLRHYRGLTVMSKAGPVWSGKVALAPDNILTDPLHRRKPVTYFVNSMSDLFHEDVPDEWLDRVFAIMIASRQHTFQILTKRAKRMRDYMASWRSDGQGFITPNGVDAYEAPVSAAAWPPANVWLGVSTERQTEADERIPVLLDTPAAVRFISAEPLLGPVDLVSPLYHDATGSSHRGYLRDKSESDDFRFHAPKLDWVIVGGESGRGARPMHPDWALSLRDQCAAAGVPFFFKQWGEWAPISDIPEEISDAAYDPPPANDPEAIRHCRVETCAMSSDGRCVSLDTPNAMSGPSPMMMMRLGRKVTKRRLRGRIHDDTPATREAALFK